MYDRPSMSFWKALGYGFRARFRVAREEAKVGRRVLTATQRFWAVETLASQYWLTDALKEGGFSPEQIESVIHSHADTITEEVDRKGMEVAWKEIDPWVVAFGHLRSAKFAKNFHLN